MPYANVSEVPDYVPKAKRKQWLEVWNSAYAAAKKEGKSDKDAESHAFAEANGVANKETKMKKFVPFAKVDESKRQVWGIVTAEVPDKDDEVCDYDGSVPYYKAVISEMEKATDGKNFFPLREMHGLSAAGKCIGFEFRNADREIFMGFEVVDDGAWKKVAEGVYTGFSHGGKMVKSWPDPVYDGCLRYIADPSEVSLVDNPCLGVAHFTYVKADGTQEIRKLKSVPVVSSGMLKKLAADSAEIRKALESRGILAKAKTKRVAGEDLTASAFAYVGDPDDTSTWKLPIKFSTEAKTKRHIRNALARFNQTEGIPSEKRDAVHAKLVAAAKEHGIDVEATKALMSDIRKTLGKMFRVKVNRSMKNAAAYKKLSGADDDMTRLAKGMYEVSQLAALLDRMGYLAFCVACEQQMEGDFASELPDMLADNVSVLVDTLVAMVAEESSELKEAVSALV